MFKNWIDSQSFSTEARSAFEESIICYSAEAFKASLLFTYLGFMQVIKDRVLQADTPNGFTPQHWGGKTSKLRDAGTWDKMTFELTQIKSPAEVFFISEDLREQVKYWKNRRNDCAHSKPNKITAGYVLAFQSFVESNLPKFMVNGSAPVLLQKIDDHFNPSLTPPGKSARSLVNEIGHAVTEDELPQFFDDLFEQFKKSRDFMQAMQNIHSPAMIDFINEVLFHAAPKVKEICRLTILANESILTSIIRKYPHHVTILENEDQLCRKLWHDLLFENYHDDFEILEILIKLKLIDDNDIEKVFDRLFSRGISASPAATQIEFFDNYNFFDLFLSRIADGYMDGFTRANASKALICKAIELKPISEEIARSIFSTFSSENHAWHLKTALNEMFISNPEKKVEYESHLSEDIGRPKYLKSLSDE